MKIALSLPHKEGSLVLFLLVLYLIIRLPLLGYLPLVKDEALYAIMVEEQSHEMTAIPTFLGYPVSWKPSPFFWIHLPFSGLGLPLEVSYRLPSFLFGLMTIPLLYGLFKNVGASKHVAFFSCAIFTVTLVSIYPNVALLTDSLNFLLVCGALYLYTMEKGPDSRFLAAAVLSFMAFFVKLVVASIIPVLAVAYFLTREKKTEAFRNPFFLASLSAVPVAFMVHLSMLEGLGLGSQLYVSDIGGHLVSAEGLGGQLKNLFGSTSIFLLSAGIWFTLSLAGLYKYWKENLFMALWYALILFPFLSGYFMMWYFLPVMPAVSFFATLILIKWKNSEKPDAFFILVFAVSSFLTLLLAGGLYVSLHADYLPEKEAGLMLAGKENVLVLGTYTPSVLAYKMLSEYGESGHPLEVGWITGPGTMTQEQVEDYSHDYHSNDYPVVGGSFSGLFTSESWFRKDYQGSKFDYIVVAGNYTPPAPGSSVIYNRSHITIYRVK